MFTVQRYAHSTTGRLHNSGEKLHDSHISACSRCDWNPLSSEDPKNGKVNDNGCSLKIKRNKNVQPPSLPSDNQTDRTWTQYLNISQPVEILNPTRWLNAISLLWTIVSTVVHSLIRQRRPIRTLLSPVLKPLIRPLISCWWFSSLEVLPDCPFVAFLSHLFLVSFMILLRCY